MADFDDLRGRRFEWIYRSGYPLNLEILDGPKAVGNLSKVTNNRPVATAHFQGFDWTLRRLKPVHGTTPFTLAFSPGGPTLAEAKWGFTGDLGIVIDGLRKYELTVPSHHVVQWENGAGETAVQFRRPWDSPSHSIKEGTILIYGRCEELDAAPLALMGLLLIYEISTFRPDPD